MAREDPLRNFRFRLEIDGLPPVGFSEVVIGATTTETIDYREGTDPTHVRKLSGMTKYGTVALKAGMTHSLDLFLWHKQVVSGQLKANRRKVLIVVMGEDGVEAARIIVNDAWPIKYQPSDLNAKGNEVLIELLELANEGIERVSVS